MKKRCLAVFGLPLVGACIGHVGTPGPTTQKVTAADAIGTWKYDADDGKTAITLEIRADGTFTQTVQPPGQAKPLTASGKWEPDGAHISLDGLLSNEAHSVGPGWVATDAWWYFADGYTGDPRVVIHGGTTTDPDNIRAFEKVPEARTQPAESSTP